MATTTMQQPASRRPRHARILAATAVAAIASAGLNAALRYAAVSAADIPQPQFEPLNLGPVVISSIVGAVAGGAFFAACAQFTARPMRVFLPVATAVLVISMIPVLMIHLPDPPRYEGASPATGLTMSLMHLIVAAALFGTLRRVHPRTEDARTAR